MEKRDAAGDYGTMSEPSAPPQAPPPPYAAAPQQPGQPPPATMGVPPLTAQPHAIGQVQMMMAPPALPGIPPGLEYLTQVDQLLVHQQIELLELMSGYEMCNKYQVKNSLGQQVYFAAEESGEFSRMLCGPLRGFKIHIINNYSQLAVGLHASGLFSCSAEEVMRVVREFKCCAGRCCCACCACLGCCQSEVTVEAPAGELIGYVREQCSVCRPLFAIFDAQNRPFFSIAGPIWQIQNICCRRDIKFKVTSYDGGQVIGKVRKQWGGYVKEAITDADNFGVTFPKDLDVKMKALLLASVFLIDFMYFEDEQTKKKQKRHQHLRHDYHH